MAQISACAKCGDIFEQPAGTGGRRKYCETCSPRRVRPPMSPEQKERERKRYARRSYDYKMRTCALCGESCWGERCARCSGRGKGPNPRTMMCSQCGARYETYDKRKGRKFCSLQCHQDAQTKRPTLECEICGSSFKRKPSDIARGGGKFCSKKCQGVDISNKNAKRRAENPKPLKPPRSRVYFRECDVCKRMFCGRNSRAKFCSAQCKIDDGGLRAKGLYAAATRFIDGKYVGADWRKTMLQYLVDRDGDRCGICNRPVDITLKSGTRGSRRGPSVDHIIPRSLGGSDDLSNLRLAHWGCNQKRGNRAGNEQLALVG